MSYETSKSDMASPSFQKSFQQRIPPLSAQELKEIDSRHHRVQELQLRSMKRAIEAERIVKESANTDGSRLSYRELYDLAPLGYLTLDRENHIIEINNAAATLFDEEKEFLLGKHILQRIKKEFHDAYLKQCENVLDMGERQTFELNMVRKKGDCFQAAIECRPWPDNNGDLTNMLLLVSDITKRIENEIKLQEANTALRVLLRQREEDKAEMERTIVSNIRKLVLPYIEKFKQSRLREDQLQYLQLIQTNIENVISPFLSSLSSHYDDMTPREIEIANLVKDGYLTKEIAALLFISPRSVEFHKDNIRKKMGLTNKAINLRSYLTSLEKSSSPR